MKRAWKAFPIGVLLLSALAATACYQLPKMDENMSFLISGEAQVNGYWGRALALTNEVAFVGDSMIDARCYSGGSVTVIPKGGCVSVLTFVREKNPPKKGERSKDKQWDIMRFPADFKNKALAGKPVTFTAKKCKTGDHFGAKIYFEPESEYKEGGSSDCGWLFVASLMAEVVIDGVETKNTGSVDLFRVEKGVTPLTVYEGTNPKWVATISLANMPSGCCLQNFLPQATGSDKSTEILSSKINPGIGFGKNIVYDGQSKVLAIAAPYESYTKDLQNNGIDQLLSKVGAVYLFEPKSGCEESLTNWELKARLMPQANMPRFKVTDVFDSTGESLGTVARMLEKTGTEEKETKDRSKQCFQCVPNDRPDYYFGEQMDVGCDNSGNVNVAVGVDNAVFKYYHPKEKGKTADRYFDSHKEDITGMVNKNKDYFYRFEEQNPSNGAIYLYQKKCGESNFTFKQRMERSHYKHEFYASVSPGAYIIKDNVDNKKNLPVDKILKGFYGWCQHENHELGSTVVIYGDAVISGVPLFDTGYVDAGYRPDTSITRVYNDMGGIVSFSLKKEDVDKPFQINDPKHFISYFEKQYGDFTSVYNDWPSFGKHIRQRGSYLGIGATGSDYSVFQSDVGRILFFQLPPKAQATADSVITQLKYIPDSMVTAKEIFKGWQHLGEYFDFTVEGQVLSGNPDFDMGIYYNNPYLQYYVMDNCGALYTFKWKKH